MIVRLEKERIELKVIPLQCQCQVSMLMTERGHPLFAVNPITSEVTKPTKNSQKTSKKNTMIERRHPLLTDSVRVSSEISEWLQELRENLVDDEAPARRDSHASSSHEESPHPRDVRIWVSTVFILISLKTEIVRSVRGPKLQGSRAEDAMAEPYVVQKMLVTR